MITMRFFLIIILIAGIKILAQEYDIVPYLKMIESGNAAEVEKIFPNLKKENPNDPSVQFLDAVLTTNGETALNKYTDIYQNYPNSNYADAALYRVFSYYFSLGLYSRAEDYLGKLKKDYPSSPYIKTADRNLPASEEVIPIISKPVAATDSQTEEYNFTIQAGAFLNVQNASNLKKSFEGEGYYSEISTKDVGGSILNVVTVGRFSVQEEANVLLKHIEEKYGLKGRVVPFPK